ncbi:transposase [Rugamonas sp. CCM 8940]|uniref:IS66 family transposase n=1 Tax=Rugamonas sp. CCM 8940 TaxID=2765359 RepID=UPI0018F29A7A|nr:transposase [Rugamonas sp. CCM 8940]
MTIVCEGTQLQSLIRKHSDKLSKQSQVHNLLRRFLLHADAILLFIADPAVPYGNRVVELAVRMPKVKQKISRHFRTADGTNNFCLGSSCLDTLRKQRHNMSEVLHRVFICEPTMPAAQRLMG